MVVPVFIIANGPFLDALLGYFQRNVDFPVGAAPVRGQYPQLYGVQSRPGVAA